ncbi:hypothetical protein RFF05_07795 [Bengtsoniella intestinalis]|uniref:hypothetical protein n=1 Tax=Bengtsoniella intestinalis TaxID=3073143 RepID=UPI00391F364F
MANNPLSMVGMALKAGCVTVGEEPCGIAAREKKARLLLLASDAADNTRRRCEHFAQEGNCIMLVVPDTKAGLGAIVGRKSCAMVAITEIGLAATIAKRLSAIDPAYAEAAEKMELKAKRAQERKTKQGPKKEKPVVENHRRDDLRSSAPQRKPYNRDGERKPYNRDGERKPFNRDGERKPFNRDGERKPYNRDGERKPFNRDGERKPFNRDGERKPFNRDGERKPFNRDGERKPYVKRDGDEATPRGNSFRGTRPVKKGKGSYRKKDNA